MGSGSSFHNMGYFFGQCAEGAMQRASSGFDEYLTDACCNLTHRDRAEQLESWEENPFAREAHPREEHLLPLHVAASAGVKDSGTKIWSDENFFGGGIMSSFGFGMEEQSVRAVGYGTLPVQ